MKFGKYSFVLALAVLTQTPVAGWAADPAAVYPKYTVCDPDYYTTLADKALAEVQREIQVNNSVITKPASVLALSCFDNQLTQAASAGGAFSDASGGKSFSETINSAIGTLYSDYYSSNFTDPPQFAGLTFASGQKIIGCDRLNQLWTSMKCSLANGIYLDSLDTQRSYTAAGIDIRGAMCNANAVYIKEMYLDGLVSSSDLEGRAGQTSKPDDYFSRARPNFCSYDPKSGADALANALVCKDTDVTPHKELKCADMNAIPTGVAFSVGVNDESGGHSETIWSYTCINPGCYFNHAANASKIKVSGNALPPSGLKCSEKPTP